MLQLNRIYTKLFVHFQYIEYDGTWVKKKPKPNAMDSIN